LERKVSDQVVFNDTNHFFFGGVTKSKVPVEDDITKRVEGDSVVSGAASTMGCRQMTVLRKPTGLGTEGAARGINTGLVATPNHTMGISHIRVGYSGVAYKAIEDSLGQDILPR
jgi:hypothetical protein